MGEPSEGGSSSLVSFSNRPLIDFNLVCGIWDRVCTVSRAKFIQHRGGGYNPFAGTVLVASAMAKAPNPDLKK